MTLPPQAIAPSTAISGQGGAASGGATAGGAGGNPPAQVTAAQQVATAIAKLPVESLLQASVQSRSGNELTLLTTLGQVSIKLPTPLPANLGDLLWVRVMPQGTPGQTAQGGNDPASTLRLQVLPQTLTPGATGTGGTASINSSPLIPGQTFAAVTTSNLTLPNGSQLPAGSQTQVIFVGQGAVSAGKAAQIANMVPSAGTSPAITTAITTGGTLAPPQTIAAGGTATPGGTTAAGTSTPLVLTGTVLPPDSPEARMLPNGFTALRTQAGVVGIKLPIPAPAGATLSFSLDTNAAAGRGAQPAAMTEAELIARGQNAALSRDWGSLQQAITALGQHDPGAAAALMNNIPQAGPKLTATMMFFFAAMNGPGGSARGWMGDRAGNSLSALEGRGGSDVLKKLEGDFASLRGMTADERPDGWRVMPMPFQMGERIEQVRLAWRHGDDENEKGEKEDPGTRFLLDLSFTEVGHTQLDGLVKGENSKFDLIVRTENPLQSENRDDIRGIFREALQISGYQGHLVFQDGSRFVEIAPSANEFGHGSHHGIEA